MDIENVPKKTKENPTTYFIRHSKSGYKTYEKHLSSNQPQHDVNKEDQVYPDLTKEGLELANKEAISFFNQLNSQKDKLFFVSSGEARAIETASIYRDIAKRQGFEIIQSKEARSPLAEKVGKGDIRVLESLTPDIKNTLLMVLFYPKGKVPDVNWEAVDSKTKEKWEKIKQIVDLDDRGSYTANMIAHSDKVKEVFPDLEQTRQNLENQMKNLKRLLQFSRKKAEEQGVESLKILAFGHDSQMALLSEELFDGEKTDNCEFVKIAPKDGFIEISKKGHVGNESYE